MLWVPFPENLISHPFWEGDGESPNLRGDRKRSLLFIESALIHHRFSRKHIHQSLYAFISHCTNLRSLLLAVTSMLSHENTYRRHAMITHVHNRLEARETFPGRRTAKVTKRSSVREDITDVTPSITPCWNWYADYKYLKSHCTLEACFPGSWKMLTTVHLQIRFLIRSSTYWITWYV